VDNIAPLSAVSRQSLGSALQALTLSPPNTSVDVEAGGWRWHGFVTFNNKHVDNEVPGKEGSTYVMVRKYVYQCWVNKFSGAIQRFCNLSSLVNRNAIVVDLAETTSLWGVLNCFLR
jgi:hypothetical protein